jgi:selenide, water dikinase
MQAPLPRTFDIVLIGGGHTHALILRTWAMNPLPGVRLTLVNPGPVAPYTGMLPGAIAGHYPPAALMIDLVRLARFAGARLVLDRACAIERDTRLVGLSSGRALRYDMASVDIGITSDLPEIAGYSAFGVAAKPLGRYAQSWEAFVQSAPQAPAVTIIGGGVGGVELALASAYRLRQTGREPSVTLLQRDAQALPGIAQGTRQTLLRAMADHGINLRCDCTATQISATDVTLSDGSRIASDFTLSVAGARPQDWLASTGLTLHQGFVSVGPSLQSSDPDIFAVGDCAHLSHAPRPKAGVFAVRQAPVLLHNLRARASGGSLKAFHPQSDYLKLISMGDKMAVADKFGLRAGGGWLWHLKDRIDRKFMAKFADYPDMAQQGVPKPHAIGLPEAMGNKPFCGGCGAKVGPAALEQALMHLPAPIRTDVLSGRGDDAAILRFGARQQVITTDHLRAFTQDPWLMAQLSAIHALGDVWAMGAEPQAALAQITLPRLSAKLQGDMLGEIMQAAAQVFRAAGADIVGGHTSIGDELTIGFTVTGLTDQARRKTTAQPGDVILLTKPIGTGVILAAEMARTRLSDPQAPLLGEIWQGCIASMQRPLAAAAQVLQDNATAMTDLTGFGLAGHLWEMLKDANLSARLDLAALPLLPGAADLAAQGVESTLAPSNREALSWHLDMIPSPFSNLLFDPQTCGGLLATVPAPLVAEIQMALARTGDSATIIGHVHSGPAHITCR